MMLTGNVSGICVVLSVKVVRFGVVFDGRRGGISVHVNGSSFGSEHGSVCEQEKKPTIRVRPIDAREYIRHVILYYYDHDDCVVERGKQCL